MTLVRWQPYRGLRDYENELNTFFNCYGDNESNDTYSPAADIRESKDVYYVTLELPGVKKEDVAIELKEDILTIKGDKKAIKSDDEVTIRSNERYFGNFEKRFSIPGTIKADQIKAKYGNGVLNLTIPKAEEAKSKQINID